MSNLTAEAKADIVLKQQELQKLIVEQYGYPDHMILAVHESNDISLITAQEKNPERLSAWLIGALADPENNQMLEYMESIVRSARAVRNGA